MTFKRLDQKFRSDQINFYVNILNIESIYTRSMRLKTIKDYKVQLKDNCLSKITDLIVLECNEACKINNF